MKFIANKTKILYRLEPEKIISLFHTKTGYHRPQKPVAGILSELIYRKMVVSARTILSRGKANSSSRKMIF